MLKQSHKPCASRVTQSQGLPGKGPPQWSGHGARTQPSSLSLSTWTTTKGLCEIQALGAGGVQCPSEWKALLLTICSSSKDYLTARSIYRPFFSLKDISVNEKLLSP